MKKQFAYFITTLILVLFIVSSCGKDDDPIVVKTKTQLLTQSSWKFKSAFVGTTDYSGFLQTCQKDNILTFSSNGSGNIDEGLTKCNGADPQNTLFTWNFQTNETILFISTPLFTNGSSTFDLISVSETELVVSQFFNPPAGPSPTVVLTFNH
jgi:hypothetical protein